MNNTTALERFINRTPETSPQAIEDARASAAISLCAIADLLEHLPANQPLPHSTMEGLATAIRELATLGAVGIV